MSWADVQGDKGKTQQNVKVLAKYVHCVSSDTNYSATVLPF